MARRDNQGVVEDRYNIDATIGRVAERVVGMLLWFKPAIRQRILERINERVQA